MSKRSYKKFKSDRDSDDVDVDRELLSVISHLARKPMDLTYSKLGKERLKGLSAQQVKQLDEVLYYTNKNNWVDYLNFLLHPISSPNKVRIPGNIASPLGTEIRCFKHFMTHNVPNTNDQKFGWAPQKYNLSDAGTNNPIGSSVQNFVIGWGTADTDWTGVYRYYPTEVKTYFVASRLLAAECRINIIQSAETSMGRVVVSPVYTSTANKTFSAISTDTENFLKPIDTLFDNKVVYDGPALAGVRMVYFPTTQESFNFTRIDRFSAEVGEAHHNRMQYYGIFRGLPAGSKIECFFSYYFEMQPHDDYYELMNAADSRADYSPVVTGTPQDVLNALNNLPDVMSNTFDLGRELELERGKVFYCYF